MSEDRSRRRPLSKEVLRLLRLLEDEGLDVRWIASYASDFLRDDPLPPDEKRDAVEFHNRIRALVGTASRNRLVPSNTSGEIDIALLERISDDDVLDYYWTHRSLGDVQSIVARVRRLRRIVLDRLPESYAT